LWFIAQQWLLLLLSFAVGVLCGWVWWGRRYEAVTRSWSTAREESRTTISSLEREISTMTRDRDKAGQRAAELESRSAACAAEREQLAARVAALEAAAKEAESEASLRPLIGLPAPIDAAADASRVALENQIRGLGEDLRRTEQARARLEGELLGAREARAAERLRLQAELAAAVEQRSDAMARLDTRQAAAAALDAPVRPSPATTPEPNAPARAFASSLDAPRAADAGDAVAGLVLAAAASEASAAVSGAATHAEDAAPAGHGADVDAAPTQPEDKPARGDATVDDDAVQTQVAGEAPLRDDDAPAADPAAAAPDHADADEDPAPAAAAPDHADADEDPAAAAPDHADADADPAAAAPDHADADADPAPAAAAPDHADAAANPAPARPQPEDAEQPEGAARGSAAESGAADATPITVDDGAVGVAQARSAVGGGAADDLTRLEGIGPRIASALHRAGLRTFAELAATDDDAIRAALHADGLRFAPSLPTWRRQAALLAAGDELGFAQLSKELTAGRIRPHGGAA
jgi:predicted flap endonuclease-1-like 5' DNA nuclease